MPVVMETTPPESTPKATRNRRTVTLKVRLTEAEEATLKARASEAGANVSDFVRGRALGQPNRRTAATPERRQLIEALAQLGKLGSNLNQIAHQLNASSGAEYDRNGLRSALGSWGQLVERIHQQLES